MLCRRDSSLVPAEVWTPDLPVYILVIVLNMLLHTGLNKVQKSVFTFIVRHLNSVFMLREQNFLLNCRLNRCAWLTINVYQLWTECDVIMQ
jgi:hypothetical protein